MTEKNWVLFKQLLSLLYNINI